jgi:L-aminopeptidase/D-esterase-like protein
MIENPPQGLLNTTIAVVATNARLTRERAHLLAIAAHDGLARAVRPAHTMWDGDTVFTLATGTIEAQQPVLERMAEAAVADAIRRAVRGQASPDRKESL